MQGDKIINTFNELEIKPQILRALIDMEFENPTPIQAEVIPYVLQGLDCLAQAPTGTGKTCAFGIPLIEKIDEDNTAVQTLIMCPTRELAKQIENELRKLLKYLEGIKVLAIYGGANFQRQLAALKKRPQIVVGTPGRILDHLNRKTLRLRGVKMVVLDEADEMLNMGFRDDMDTILKEVDPTAQKIFFSATMPKAIMEISRSYQTNPMSVKTTCKESDMPEIKQYFIRLKEGNKLDAFDRLMREQELKYALVFCNTKRRVDEVEKKLNSLGYRAMALHGDLRQSRRDFVMQGFRQKEFDVLVATDVAARGIDVDDIEAIFNYDMPLDDEYYIHRIGRTARANKKGVAYSFASAKDIHRVSECEKYINAKMEEIELNGLTDLELGTKKNRLVTTNSVRIFSNVGSKDNASVAVFEKFICDSAKISTSEILEVKLLDTYSFVEVVSEAAAKVIALTGMSYGKRKTVFEVASPKSNSGSGTRSSRGSFSNDRKPSRFGDDSRSKSSNGRADFNKFNDKKPRFDRDNSEKTIGEMTQGDDNSSFKSKRSPSYNKFMDKKPRSDRPFEDRKPRDFSMSGLDNADSERKPRERKYGENKPRNDKPFGERKPRGERNFEERKERSDNFVAGKPRDDRSYTDRKPRADRPFEDRKPRSEGSFERTPKTEWKTDGKKERPYEDRKPRADRPFEDRKPRVEKSFGTESFESRKPRAFGGKKPRGEVDAFFVDKADKRPSRGTPATPDNKPRNHYEGKKSTASFGGGAKQKSENSYGRKA